MQLCDSDNRDQYVDLHIVGIDKLHVNVFISHFDVNKLHVNIDN